MITTSVATRIWDRSRKLFEVSRLVLLSKYRASQDEQVVLRQGVVGRLQIVPATNLAYGLSNRMSAKDVGPKANFDGACGNNGQRIHSSATLRH
jgi:hypothetical protein